MHPTHQYRLVWLLRYPPPVLLNSPNEISNHNVPRLKNSLFELLYDRDGSVGIQSSGGLIEKQHLGLYDQFHSDTGPLPLSTRYSTKKLIPNLHTSIFNYRYNMHYFERGGRRKRETEVTLVSAHFVSPSSSMTFSTLSFLCWRVMWDGRRREAEKWKFSRTVNVPIMMSSYTWIETTWCNYDNINNLT